MRSVFGYFQTMEQAQKAAIALKAQGYQASVDRFAPALGGNPNDLDEEIYSIFRHPGNSLSTTSLGSSVDFNDDERILASTHVDANGQSGGSGFEHVEDICVTVITDEAGYKKAESTLQELGAK